MGQARFHFYIFSNFRFEIYWTANLHEDFSRFKERKILSTNFTSEYPVRYNISKYEFHSFVGEGRCDSGRNTCSTFCPPWKLLIAPISLLSLLPSPISAFVIGLFVSPFINHYSLGTGTSWPCLFNLQVLESVDKSGHSFDYERQGLLGLNPREECILLSAISTLIPTEHVALGKDIPNKYWIRQTWLCWHPIRCTFRINRVRCLFGWESVFQASQRD